MLVLINPSIRPWEIGALSIETHLISKEMTETVAIIVSAYMANRNDSTSFGTALIPKPSSLVNESRPPTGIAPDPRASPRELRIGRPLSSPCQAQVLGPDPVA